MSLITIVQIISLPACFIFGIGVAYAMVIRDRHLGKSEAAMDKAQQPSPNSVQPPQELKDRLVQEAEADYQKVLDASTEKFTHDLTDTTATINSQIKNLSTNIIATELEEYRLSLAKLREQTLAGMGEAQAEVQKQREALEADMKKEVEAQKQKLLSQLDTKLNDAVSAFLVETLQHHVDLGAQTAYLQAMLEEHKEELKAEVSNVG